MNNSTSFLVLTTSLLTISTLFILRARHLSEAAISASKLSKRSSLVHHVKVSNDQCTSGGNLLGGELFKLADVAAGTVAAVHCEGNCLTASCDRVIFLREIREGEVLQIQAGVNRAWGSSMEIGVRVSIEDDVGQNYCAHFYFTFVMLPSQAQSTFLTPVINSLTPAFFTKQKVKAQVPALIPSSALEKRRFILAGRRRTFRLAAKGDNDELLLSFNQQILELEQEELEQENSSGPDSASYEGLLLEIQRELILEAYNSGERTDMRVEGNEIIALVEGEEIRASVIETSTKLEPIPRESRPRKSLSKTINLSSTISSTIYIIRPLHINSKQVLFGGQLGRWIEESATIAAKRISRKAEWKSASLDSLSFKGTTRIGDRIIIRSVVTKVWNRSIEVFVLVLAENRNDPTKPARLISNSFFSLVAPSVSDLKALILPEGPALAVSLGADARKVERLKEKALLIRVYA